MSCGSVNSTALERFGDCYWHLHGYVSLALCIYGVITNIINVSILTKKSMINPINCLLTGIAIADMITMSSYIPFAVHFYLLNGDTPNPTRNTFGWMVFLTVHTNLTLTSHTASIWLGVTMAIMRYVIVRSSQARGARSVTLRTSILLIVCAFCGSAFLVIPNYLITDIRPYPDANNTRFWVLDSPIGKNETDSMATLTFLVYPIAGKIVPIILISIFGGLLLRTLWETDKRGRRLKGDNSSSHQQNRRTTMMLLAIIVMYIISEVPQSVLVLMCVFATPGFFRRVYMPLSDVIDVISLINSAINFSMYCTMSRQFRSTLAESINACIRSCRKKREEHGTTSEVSALTHV
ncbi:G-protein coupled receptor dmsr-1-like [Babylonia areolata]|uniref:G-protein coupled receptor dmsr-1-like n=1 Tax=Babylonia areolata TaxID=304850 RepID=UPI003FCF7376